MVSTKADNDLNYTELELDWSRKISRCNLLFDLIGLGKIWEWFEQSF